MSDSTTETRPVDAWTREPEAGDQKPESEGGKGPKSYELTRFELEELMRKAIINDYKRSGSVDAFSEIRAGEAARVTFNKYRFGNLKIAALSEDEIPKAD
jgi:hypothetical protein